MFPVLLQEESESLPANQTVAIPTTAETANNTFEGFKGLPPANTLKWDLQARSAAKHLREIVAKQVSCATVVNTRAICYMMHMMFPMKGCNISAVQQQSCHCFRTRR